MASFRMGKTDHASTSRLYSLPRRELQTLCKQYGVPTYTSNVAMADALSAQCALSVDHTKPKASWVSANPARESKTTPLMVKWDRGLPEVSFTSSGKRKTSPVNLAEKPSSVGDAEEARLSLKSTTITPLRRTVKRSERNAAVSTPGLTRGALHRDRFGRSVAATSSHRQQAGPTPGKRRLGKESALPPGGSFSGLFSTPKTSEVQIMRRTFSKYHPQPIDQVSNTEIEFRDAALHKELFGVRMDVTAVREMEDDATPVVAREDMIVSSESPVEVGFEFRNMALHKELFGSHPVIHATSSQGYNNNLLLPAPHGVHGLGESSADMVYSSKRGICTSSSTEVLDFSGHDIRVLSSIPEEGAGDGDSGSKLEKVAEHIQTWQGRDLGPLLDCMSCDSPPCSLTSLEVETSVASGHTEPGSVLSPTGAHLQIPSSSPLVKPAATTPLTKIRSNIGCTLTKATSILEKLAALRADAEKKSREGYWEPKFSANVVGYPPPAAVFDTALAVDRGLPSAKKARLTPKSMKEEPIVCEDADVVPKTMRILDVYTGHYMSAVSDKENRSPMMGMDDWKARKFDGLGKEKGEKFEALKDRSENLLDHVNNKINEPGVIKSGVGEVRPEELSLRKLRAQFKEKIRHLEASKSSDLRPWSQRGA